MAFFEPPEMKRYDGINLPGISIASPCFLAETSRIAVVAGGSIDIGVGFGLSDYSMILTYGGNIKIKGNVSIQTGCMIYGHGGLTIGTNVSIAAHTIIIPSNHNFENMDIPIKIQGDSGQGIVIGNDVWIGAGCKILDGVTIGDGCVVGAGSVVTRSMPENCIVAGVPAKVLKKRKKSDYKISKNEIIAGQTPLILLVISSSYEEIDWILPALMKFKQKNPEYEMITLFGDKDVYRLLTTNKFIFRQFLRLSSLNIVPEEIPSLFSENIFPDQVKMILKDSGKDDFTPYKEELSQRCPKALQVNFPQSSTIYSKKDRETVQTCDFPESFSKHDLFLVGSEHDIPFWSHSVDIKKIKALGYPKYDSWWVKESLEDFVFLKSDEYRLSKAAKTVFLFIPKEPDSYHQEHGDDESFIQAMLDIVGDYQDALLLIKIHPSQNIKKLVDLLKSNKRLTLHISTLHLLQLAYISDVIISQGSCGILDSLALKKPGIEFRWPTGKNSGSRGKHKGGETTIYRELNLVAPAETKQELHEMIDSALNDSGAAVWKNNQKAFKSICKFTDFASEDIADYLTDLLR